MSSGQATASLAMAATSVRFADTNVLLYAISRDASEQDKAALANSLLDAADLCLSVQVLQEFYVQATRASRSTGPAATTRPRPDRELSAFPVQETTTDLMRATLTTSERFRHLVLGRGHSRGQPLARSHRGALGGPQ